MVVIDRKKNKAYENVSQVEAARLIGVSRQTIIRWGKDLENTSQVYNSFEIFFNVEKLKRRRGRPLPPPKRQNTTFRRP